MFSLPIGNMRLRRCAICRMQEEQISMEWSERHRLLFENGVDVLSWIQSQPSKRDYPWFAASLHTNLPNTQKASAKQDILALCFPAVCPATKRLYVFMNGRWSDGWITCPLISTSQGPGRGLKTARPGLWRTPRIWSSPRGSPPPSTARQRADPLPA